MDTRKINETVSYKKFDSVASSIAFLLRFTLVFFTLYQIHLLNISDNQLILDKEQSHQLEMARIRFSSVNCE